MEASDRTKIWNLHVYSTRIGHPNIPVFCGTSSGPSKRQQTDKSVDRMFPSVFR